MTGDRATEDQFRTLVEAMRPGATLVRSWPLEGGVSAHVTAVELALPDGTTERVVVRQHGAIDKGHNPDIATDEYRLLATVTGAGLAAPAPVLLDQDGALIGAPGLVTTYIEGSTEPDDGAVLHSLDQMATFLARLHALDLDRLDVAYLPRRENPVPGILADLGDSPRDDRIRAAIAARGPYVSTNTPVLLHGDYWPGNVMWRDGRIAAVLDWEDAAIGDPLADLGSCRLELLWKYDEDAMTSFTGRYLAQAPVDTTNLAYWELRSAHGARVRMHEWGLDTNVEADMRRKAGWIIDRALVSLAAG